MSEAPAFHLDRAKHQYWYDGRIIPGITSVLRYWNIVDTTYFTERGRQVGTAVHAWSTLLDRGAMGWERVSTAPEVEGRLRAYEKFLKDYAPEWEHTEKSFYYPGGLYACTIDRAGKMKDIPWALLELKCGAKAGWHALQTGMQSKTLEAFPWRRFALYLKADGTYRLEEHRNHQDGLIGIGLVSAMNWRLANAA